MIVECAVPTASVCNEEMILGVTGGKLCMMADIVDATGARPHPAPCLSLLPFFPSIQKLMRCCHRDGIPQYCAARRGD
jgi:hypothetical protein